MGEQNQTHNGENLSPTGETVAQDAGQTRSAQDLSEAIENRSMQWSDFTADERAPISEESERKWALLDAQDFEKISDPQDQFFAAALIAQNMDQHAHYKDTLHADAPQVASAAEAADEQIKDRIARDTDDRPLASSIGRGDAIMALEESMRRADWYADYSDDSMVRARGHEHLNKIYSALKELAKSDPATAAKLWDEHTPATVPGDGGQLRQEFLPASKEEEVQQSAMAVKYEIDLDPSSLLPKALEAKISVHNDHQELIRLEGQTREQLLAAVGQYNLNLMENGVGSDVHTKSHIAGILDGKSLDRESLAKSIAEVTIVKPTHLDAPDAPQTTMREDAEAQAAELRQRHVDANSRLIIEARYHGGMAVPVGALTALESRDWAQDDAQAFGQIVSKEARFDAALTIAANSETHAGYKAEFLKAAPEFAQEIALARAEMERRNAAEKSNEMSSSDKSGNAGSANAVEKARRKRVKKGKAPALPVMPGLIISEHEMSLATIRRSRETEEVKALLGKQSIPYAATASAESSTPQTTQPQPAPPPAQSDKEPKPAEVRRLFLITEESRPFLPQKDSYYFRDQQDKLAFEDKGTKLVTKHNDDRVAVGMVALALSKNWDTIKVSGSDEFRREVWLQGELRDLTVNGYKPTPFDQARLREMKGNRHDNTIEKVKGREPSADILAFPAAHALASAPEMSNGKEADSSQSAKAASPTPQAGHGRYYGGVLVEHGKAPFNNNPNEKASYFVTLNTAAGQKTVWGIDLERAMRIASPQKGEDIAIHHHGKRSVEVMANVVDAKGNITGVEPKIVTRNDWTVERRNAHEKIFEAAVGKVLDAQIPNAKMREVVMNDIMVRLQDNKAQGKAIPQPVMYDKSAKRAEPKTLPMPVAENAKKMSIRK